MGSPGTSSARRLKTAGPSRESTGPTVTAGRRSPGAGPSANQPALAKSTGAASVPSARTARCSSWVSTPMEGIVKVAGGAGWASAADTPRGSGRSAARMDDPARGPGTPAAPGPATRVATGPAVLVSTGPGGQPPASTA